MLSTTPSKRRLPRITLFTILAAASAIVVACGHQVTPEPPLLNSNLSGKVVVRFDTTAALNFNQYAYAIVINTCGNGVVPYPNVYGTSFLGYTFAFFIGGAYNTAGPQLFEYYLNSNSNGKPVPINEPLPPALTSFNPNNNGTGTEFELIFSRALLDNPFPTLPLPCTGATAAPTSSAGATPTPTATATATGTGSPTSAPSPSPTGSPLVRPTTSAQSTWIFNFITFSLSGTPLDSLGVGGANDNTYPGVLINVNTVQTNPITRSAPNSIPADPSSQIAGGEIDNYP